MTIYDIAKVAGVSASTVSRVLNDKPGINARTRERVKRVLDKTGFSVNESARGLVEQSSRMIGILVSDIRNQHHISGAYMIEEYFRSRRQVSLIINAGGDVSAIASPLRTLASRRVNGLVLIGSVFQDEAVSSALQAIVPDIPVVMQNGVLDLPNVSAVLCDDRGGTMEATMHLHQSGRRHVAYINNNLTPSNNKKVGGYLEACQELGMEPVLVQTCSDAEDATAQLLDANPGLDGIIYSVDFLAAGGLRVIHKMGLRVPDDIAVLGTDDSPLARLLDPRLSSIDTKLEQLSHECALLLEEMMENGGVRKVKTIACSLALRETG